MLFALAFGFATEIAHAQGPYPPVPAPGSLGYAGFSPKDPAAFGYYGYPPPFPRGGHALPYVPPPPGSAGPHNALPPPAPGSMYVNDDGHCRPSSLYSATPYTPMPEVRSWWSLPMPGPYNPYPTMLTGGPDFAGRQPAPWVAAYTPYPPPPSPVPTVTRPPVSTQFAMSSPIPDDSTRFPPPSVPHLPVAPEEPCEPMFITKVGPACASGGGVAPAWTDCMTRPNQSPGGYCVYGRAEVLYWWLQPQSVSGLSSTGNISNNSVTVPGYSLDIRNAVSNYNDLIDANHLGLRFTGGVWLNEENTWAIEGNVFGTLSAPSPYYASGGPSLAASPGTAASLASVLNISQAQATTLLNGLTGNNVVATGGFFAGTELNLRHEICRSEYGHVDWLLGARMMELYEYGGVMDSFGAVLVNTQNQFIGGQVGLEGELSHGRFYLDGVGKVALGVNHEIVSIGTTNSGPASVSSLMGNQGVQNRDVFATVGEVGLTAGVRLGCNTRLFANYTLIYLTDAVRPLPQAAPYLGGAIPSFSFMSSSYWAQGASVGLEFRF
jgi:hypothetical protein